MVKTSRIRIPEHPSFLDLKDFLGVHFDRSLCNAFDEKGEEEAKEYKTSEDFFRNTLIFTYQSIGLSVQGIHRPYHSIILAATMDKPGLALLDVGAGSGEDALLYHHAGFFVSVAEISGKTYDFLEWRMRRHGIRNVYRWDLPGLVIPKHDIAICFDVIEHLNPEQQIELIDALGAVGKAVFVNLIREDEELSDLHFSVNFENLTEYALGKFPGKVWYKDFYPDERGFRQRLLAFGENVKCEKLSSV